MNFIKALLILLLCLLLFSQSVLAQDTYYVTGLQLENLKTQINNLRLNNSDMMSLLELQKNELEKQKLDLEMQMNEYQTLETNYSEKFQIMEKQLQNSQQLLNRSKNRESIYKYSIGIAFSVGIILGFIIAK